MRVHLRAICALITSAAFISACTAQRAAVLPTSASAPPAAQPQHSPLRRATLTIHIRVPRRRHRHGNGPHYVSPSTQGATLAFTGTQTFTKSVALTVGSNDVALSLAAGTYKASISTYDKAPVNGVVPSDAKLLSTASNLPLSVLVGKANVANFTLDGAIASLVLHLPTGTIGTPFATPQAIGVVAKDAGGSTIVGTYSTPVSVTDADASHTSVATSGSDNPPAGELLSSSDTATLSYDGSNANFSAAIQASVSNTIASNATFAPAPVLTSISITTALDGTGANETLTGIFSPGHTSVVFPDGSQGIASVNATAATATQITATFFVDPHVAVSGSVNVAVQTDAGAASQPRSFTVSTTGVDVVTKETDSLPGSRAGICPDGATGELRYTLCHASAGDTIVFDTTSMCGANAVTGNCTITLAAPLPPIVQNQTIDGGLFTVGAPRVVIDGASSYRGFWLDSGTVTLQNLQIQNVLAQGGAGGKGTSGGGGGAGLGGGLFVNSATVNVTNDYFWHCAVTGGNGGATGFSLGGGGGGGGMGATGGTMPVYPAETNPQDLGGAGGGGVLGNGANASDGYGGNGGYGGGGGGAQQVSGPGSPNVGGSGGAGYGGNTAGSNYPHGGAGGNGGFGGGGGGGGLNNSGSSGVGGTGGFGGGGGGTGAPSSGSMGNGGPGGPGGGGGGYASSTSVAGAGGALATISGGNGGTNNSGQGPGGGGAAAGAAIFVVTGTLTTTGSVSTSCVTATAGSAGGSGATAGGTDTTDVYNNGGTVNGYTTKGGVSSALPVVIGPSLRKSRHAKVNRKN